MQFCVAAFPNLSSHKSWINEFRAQNDPLARFIEPHITLVFPTSALTGEQLDGEISKLVKGVVPFRLALRSAMIMPEIGSMRNQAHIFLVPDEGFGSLVRLHDRLYSGRLKADLRLDIPFVPHLTIGAGINLKTAKALTDSLNAKDFEIGFTLQELFIVKIEEQNRERVISPPITLG